MGLRIFASNWQNHNFCRHMKKSTFYIFLRDPDFANPYSSLQIHTDPYKSILVSGILPLECWEHRWPNRIIIVAALIDRAHQIAKTALIIARHICVTIHFSQPERRRTVCQVSPRLSVVGTPNNLRKHDDMREYFKFNFFAVVCRLYVVAFWMICAV